MNWCFHQPQALAINAHRRSTQTLEHLIETWHSRSKQTYPTLPHVKVDVHCLRMTHVASEVAANKAMPNAGRILLLKFFAHCLRDFFVWDAIRQWGTGGGDGEVLHRRVGSHCWSFDDWAWQACCVIVGNGHHPEQRRNTTLPRQFTVRKFEFEWGYRRKNHSSNIQWERRYLFANRGIVRSMTLLQVGVQEWAASQKTASTLEKTIFIFII